VNSATTVRDRQEAHCQRKTNNMTAYSLAKPLAETLVIKDRSGVSAGRMGSRGPDSNREPLDYKASAQRPIRPLPAPMATQCSHQPPRSPAGDRISCHERCHGGATPACVPVHGRLAARTEAAARWCRRRGRVLRGRPNSAAPLCTRASRSNVVGLEQVHSDGRRRHRCTPGEVELSERENTNDWVRLPPARRSPCCSVSRCSVTSVQYSSSSWSPSATMSAPARSAADIPPNTTPSSAVMPAR
jgi:hypothetical protein